MGYRGFIAVEVGGLSPILAVSEELKRARGQLKVVEADNIHMTIKFLGDVKEEDSERILKAMCAAVKGVEPFDMTMRGMGVFPSESDIRVVWIGVAEPKPLEKIFEGVEKGVKKLGFKPEGRGFSPHVTLARVRGQRNLPNVKAVIDAHAGDDFGIVRVDTIFLKKSFLTNEGPVYTTVGTAKLGE
jgi:2'-5' RNA ligase